VISAIASGFDVSQLLSVGVIAAIVGAITLFIKVRPEADQVIVASATQVVTALRGELERVAEARRKLEEELDASQAKLRAMSDRVDECNAGIRALNESRSADARAYDALQRDVAKMGIRLERVVAERDEANARAAVLALQVERALRERRDP
jgi:septal ring factor EnvC (AmiA/AmiB activator)